MNGPPASRRGALDASENQGREMEARRSFAWLISCWASASSIGWLLKAAASSIAIIWPAMLLRLVVIAWICASSVA